MGLFDFAKEIGNKLFSHEDEAATKISDHIQANNPGIKDLSVIYNEGKVTIIGVTENPEAAQKVVLMAGNIQGVTEVIPKIEINEVEDQQLNSVLEPENVVYYEIQSGDTLSKIARKYYQDAMAYPKIFEANKEVIKDPNLIYPGQKIRIPVD